jgi:hypothetical protein
LKEKIIGSGLKTEINGHRDTLHWPRDTLYTQKLALIFCRGSRSVGIVRLRNKGHGVSCVTFKSPKLMLGVSL